MRRIMVMNNDTTGFTLIELMVGVAILVLLAGFSIPVIANSIPNYRFRSEVRQLDTVFTRARFEAIKRKVDVVINFVSSTQYTVFVDDGGPDGTGNSSDKIQNGSEETIIDVNTASNVTLAWSFSTNKSGFNSRGLPLTSTTGSIDITGTMRDGTTQKKAIAHLSNSGNLRLLMDVDGDGTVGSEDFNF